MNAGKGTVRSRMGTGLFPFRYDFFKGATIPGIKSKVSGSNGCITTARCPTKKEIPIPGITNLHLPTPRPKAYVIPQAYAEHRTPALERITVTPGCGCRAGTGVFLHRTV